MKTSVLRQTVRTEDGTFLFAVPALLLAFVRAVGALTLMMGPTTDETVPAATTPESEPLTTFVGPGVSAPMSRGGAMHRLVATAALVVVLPLAAAQPTTPTPPDHERAYAAAHAEYDIGHYAAAFVAFAALADAGHVESARVAIQMHRYAMGLYQQRFAAGPKQIGRWTAILSCRNQAAATADACSSVSSGERRSAASAARWPPCATC